MSKYRSISTEELAYVFKALSNEHRISIVQKLMECCPPKGESDKNDCCSTQEKVVAFVGDLGKDLGIAQSTLSHHLKELNQSGLVKMERNGKFISCTLNSETIELLNNFFNMQNKTEEENK